MLRTCCLGIYFIVVVACSSPVTERTGGLAAEGMTCRILDFDTDDQGGVIRRGQALADAYATDWGVTIQVWRNVGLDDPGLGVAFDTEDPTGGDWDLSHPGEGYRNVLISQEHPRDDEIAAGFVDEPDDDANGAIFELVFQDPQCVTSLDLFDIDDDEPHVMITLYDAGGDELAYVEIPPFGDGAVMHFELPEASCGVARMLINICSSGAMDNIEICACDDGGEPRELWRDLDEDGFGDPDDRIVSCRPLPGYVDDDRDCDDTDDDSYPGAPETCDGRDNDCNGVVDDDAVDQVEWYRDADGDGYGDPDSQLLACPGTPPAGYVVNDDDCDDGDPAIHPGAPDVPNGVDDDCDGAVDEG